MLHRLFSQQLDGVRDLAVVCVRQHLVCNQLLHAPVLGQSQQAVRTCAWYCYADLLTSQYQGRRHSASHTEQLFQAEIYQGLALVADLLYHCSVSILAQQLKQLGAEYVSCVQLYRTSHSSAAACIP